MNIHLHIDRLVLDGLPLKLGQNAHVQAAVEAELTRLLTEQGLATSLQTGGLLPNLPADPIKFAPDSTPSQMGTQIAQAVYTGIGNTK